jgi:cytochrome c biogenesis protein CcmG, thiol:disulfide interchange protein DsbE
MKWLHFIVPVAVVVLAAWFFRDLIAPLSGAHRSTLVGRPAPALALPALDRTTRQFTSTDLRSGHVTVVNVWASWCVPCRAEAPALAAISRTRSAKLYGIVYEDKPAAAREFLKQIGNPFARLNLDADGRAGKVWGVYGLPETFVIDGKGIVRLRFTGPIVANTLTDVIMPAIVSASHQS